MRIARAAVSFIVSLPLLAQYQATGGKGANFYSLEKEAALGEQLATEMRQRTTAIENPHLQEYVDRIGQKLADHSPNARSKFTFSVIAEDPCPTVHEPAALPAGYVFVPAALFLAAQDEAEFAGMLAHAMEHVAERHGTRQATRGEIAGSASVPLVFMGGINGCASDQAVPLGFVAFQRNFERQADFLAVQAMARAGYDPRALARYIERVQPPVPPPSTARAAFSPLPRRDDRVGIMESAISKVPATQYAAPAPGEFSAAQEEVRRFIGSHHTATPSLRQNPPE